MHTLYTSNRSPVFAPHFLADLRSGSTPGIHSTPPSAHSTLSSSATVLESALRSPGKRSMYVRCTSVCHVLTLSPSDDATSTSSAAFRTPDKRPRVNLDVVHDSPPTVTLNGRTYIAIDSPLYSRLSPSDLAIQGPPSSDGGLFEPPTQAPSSYRCSPDYDSLNIDLPSNYRDIPALRTLPPRQTPFPQQSLSPQLVYPSTPLLGTPYTSPSKTSTASSNSLTSPPSSVLSSSPACRSTYNASPSPASRSTGRAVRDAAIAEALGEPHQTYNIPFSVVQVSPARPPSGPAPPLSTTASPFSSATSRSAGHFNQFGTTRPSDPNAPSASFPNVVSVPNVPPVSNFSSVPISRQAVVPNVQPANSQSANSLPANGSTSFNAYPNTTGLPNPTAPFPAQAAPVGVNTAAASVQVNNGATLSNISGVHAAPFPVNPAAAAVQVNAGAALPNNPGVNVAVPAPVPPFLNAHLGPAGCLREEWIDPRLAVHYQTVVNLPAVPLRPATDDPPSEPEDYLTLTELLSGLTVEESTSVLACLNFTFWGVFFNPCRVAPHPWLTALHTGDGKRRSVLQSSTLHKTVYIMVGKIASCNIFNPIVVYLRDGTRRVQREVGLHGMLQESDTSSAHIALLFGETDLVGPCAMGIFKFRTYIQFAGEISRTDPDDFQFRVPLCVSRSTVTPITADESSMKKYPHFRDPHPFSHARAYISCAFAHPHVLPSAVPIFDGRGVDGLPRFSGQPWELSRIGQRSYPTYNSGNTGNNDLPPNAVVTVGYTAHLYEPRTPVQGLSQCLSYNLQFVVLLALPSFATQPNPSLAPSSASASTSTFQSSASTCGYGYNAPNVPSGSQSASNVVYYQDLYHQLIL
ncbi:hypothetical protein F5878DRAFT_667539 [Lentinula raphanica]|uniref:Uncharacterized protein n=1 Tax=Lentinula raphanica TaxID=153919 RepID=A0AA38U384_9AGAR|nr:hypothetical protein F5878DRAFT_667539 [Lentinula raphanica]